MTPLDALPVTLPLRPPPSHHAGDSGNDILMLDGQSPAIVVGNAQPELLAWLTKQPQVGPGVVASFDMHAFCTHQKHALAVCSRRALHRPLWLPLALLLPSCLLTAQPQDGKIVLAEASYADGILEGLARHGLF